MYKESAAYHLLILLHSWLRWAVLLSGTGVVAIAIGRMRTKKEWDRFAGTWALAFLITSTAEMVTGFFLYFFVTPWVSFLVSFPEQVMAARGMRFWGFEHTAATAAALALTWWGRVKVAEAKNDRKASVALLWFGSAMLLILIWMPWPFLRFGRPLLRF
jgi:hypothetical protein